LGAWSFALITPNHLKYVDSRNLKTLNLSLSSGIKGASHETKREHSPLRAERMSVLSCGWLEAFSSNAIYCGDGKVFWRIKVISRNSIQGVERYMELRGGFVVCLM